MNFNPSRVFFRNHEYRQNKMLLEAVKWFLILIPIILLPKLLGKSLRIYELFHWQLAVEAGVIYVVGVLVASIIFKLRPYASIVKYIILLMIELDIFLISINPAFDLFISFLLVPFISLLYLDRKFTLQACIGCYVIMIISLVYRGIFVIPTFENPPTSKYWTTVHVVGLSIEYVLSMFVINMIIRRYNKIVRMDYEAVYKSVNTQNTITKSYMAMLSQKIPGIDDHLQRSSEYVQIICSRLQISKKYSLLMTDEMLFAMTTCSLVHDIGIITVPDYILQKQTELTEDEQRILNTHVIQGERLLRENFRCIKRQYLNIACDMAICHHERWDGLGFPNKLKGDEIPLSGRIMAAANILDNLLTGTRLKQRLEFSEAINEIKNMSGKELDPDIVEVILQAEDEIYRVSQNS